MHVKQRLNNNVVLVENSSDKSVMIVMGKGVGYKAYPGDTVSSDLVDKTFILKDNVDNELAKISALIQEIPMVFIEISNDVIKIAESEFETEFGLSMLISLADHIYSAIDRKNKNIQMVTPLHWDIKQLYPTEVRLGEKAVQLINQKLEIDLDETEATAIAMHFISNVKNYESMQQAMNFTKVISDILSIIQYHFQIKIDQSSLSFSRLVTHLQYFLIRQVKEIGMEAMTDDMMKLVLQQYPESFQCSDKILNYLSENQKVKPSLEEEIYLTIHIERVRQSEL
ncbi:PRD domain-containing protein [Vagococcus hydrophili]|uniref:PRD domain-containing protein n=1 Tax=Vagococcus hydrophili TaxID=2714947 RepID=A0A6G8ATZ6_9ENTE|nr:PRD domain-containing protein [Vagococcus hydrophili]QIL48534.1 PRD domain-containing protein [Vagococcus hydrophili]